MNKLNLTDVKHIFVREWNFSTRVQLGGINWCCIDDTTSLHNWGRTFTFFCFLLCVCLEGAIAQYVRICANTHPLHYCVLVIASGIVRCIVIPRPMYPLVCIVYIRLCYHVTRCFVLCSFWKLREKRINWVKL